jgi:hypothetical protein
MPKSRGDSRRKVLRILSSKLKFNKFQKLYNKISQLLALFLEKLPIRQIQYKVFFTNVMDYLYRITQGTKIFNIFRKSYPGDVIKTDIFLGQFFTTRITILTTTRL